MRIAVISDIHGNLTALEAVLADLAGERVDQIVCLGDLAFKGPQPAECVARIRELGIPCIRGNTDVVLVAFAGPTPPPPQEVPPEFADKYRWPAERLSTEDVAFLAALPFDYRLKTDGQALRFVHASPKHVAAGITPAMSPEQIRALLEDDRSDWLVCGHVHRAFAFRFEDRWLVSPGAVGFSLDGDGRAAYAVLDTARCRIELRRVAYDVDAQVEAARERGFCYDPDRYGQALRSGVWPADL